MKRAAAILGAISGVLLFVGIDPRPLIALGMIVLVLVAWGRGLVAKTAFGKDFWLPLATLLLLPVLLYQVLVSIGWPVLSLLILAAFIFGSLKLRRKILALLPRKQLPTGTRGVERTPMYPAHDFESDEEF